MTETISDRPCTLFFSLFLSLSLDIYIYIYIYIYAYIIYFVGVCTFVHPTPLPKERRRKVNFKAEHNWLEFRVFFSARPVA